MRTPVSPGQGARGGGEVRGLRISKTASFSQRVDSYLVSLI